MEMEMKELYIAPEVEIICFRPVENLANDFMAGWNFTGGSGGVDNEGTIESVGGSDGNDPNNGEP